MKATYRSKPFEAFQLAPDMSNWKEALEFIGQTPSKEWDGSTPEFLDIPVDGFWAEAYPGYVIAKYSESSFEIFDPGFFHKHYDQV